MLSGTWVLAIFTINERVACFKAVKFFFLDIDECNLAEKVCVRENEDCVNTPGSYKCVCSESFEEKDGICVQTVKAG